MTLAIGDSFLHGPRLGNERDLVTPLFGLESLQQMYDTEDGRELRRIPDHP